MSRSHKKHLIFKAHGPYGKFYANRSVRRHKGRIPNGGWYKKLAKDQWDVIDYIDVWENGSPKHNIRKYKAILKHTSRLIRENQRHLIMNEATWEALLSIYKDIQYTLNLYYRK